MNARASHLLAELASFVRDEQQANHQRLVDLWERPLAEKLAKGWSQDFTRVEPGPEPSTLWAWLGSAESRLREGDLLLLHAGSPLTAPLVPGLALELDEGERWLLRGRRAAALAPACAARACWADPDGIDLSAYFERTLEEIGRSQIGRELVLPLLTGELEPTFDDRDIESAERAAHAEGFNPLQAQAVGLAFGAHQLACIQGPPGTGKTRVLALLVRLLVERGERVLVTSHTHMAINNALNRIHAYRVPIAKIGRDSQRKGLATRIEAHENIADWAGRPTNGYVVGATPFATCTTRLENVEFDSVIFDEASQITVPLALMAMRKGRRFVFIGDQKQLPPVVLSRSVLDAGSPSVFSALTAQDADHTVMLCETYRMNRWLSAWPSRVHYAGRLVSAGTNRERRLVLAAVPPALAPVLAPQASGVFVPTRTHDARTQNAPDAALVVALCAAALEGGLDAAQVGIVTPYRAQGRLIRQLLARRFGRALAGAFVADTVERMQGQERELVIVSLATGDVAFLGAVASFFFQPARLNVSVTRAVSKLIVIGPDPARIPMPEAPALRPWVDQYSDLVGALERVELPALRL